MINDVVLYNGKVVTVDTRESIAEAVAVKPGKLPAVGSNEEVMPLTEAETEAIDLRGSTVIPGFIESHCHISSGEGLQ
jgi:predicted amidohydrolase YtcJ